MKLIHANCIDEMNHVPDTAVVVTDPPFNIGYHYNTYTDKMKEEEYYEMLVTVIGNRPAVIVHYAEQLHKLSIKLGKAPDKVVSWVYNSNTPRQHRQIAFYGVKPDFKKVGQPYKNPTDKRIAKRIAEGKTAKLYDWWNINQIKNVSKEKTAHTCQMPVAVMDKIVGILPEGITIVDPFMGSGTTGVACKNRDINFIGIEQDLEYFAIAKKRICG